MNTIRLDAHQHFWTYHPDQQGWIDESMQVIRKDFFLLISCRFCKLRLWMDALQYRPIRQKQKLIF